MHNKAESPHRRTREIWVKFFDFSHPKKDVGLPQNGSVSMYWVGDLGLGLDGFGSRLGLEKDVLVEPKPSPKSQHSI